MTVDVVDLREFYLSPLGLVVRRLLAARLGRMWPSVRGQHVLALGYGVPLLRPLLADAASLAAMMSADQGVAYWPGEGPNLSCFVDTHALPLPDESIDRVLVLHGLESDRDPAAMLREIWRVMKSGGQMVIILPNRRGLWAFSDHTPFGTGQPYSGFQIKNSLRDHGFLTNRIGHALYLPPAPSRLGFSLADKIEHYGERFFPGLGGVLVVEAGKQLYAPLLTKAKTMQRRLVLPLPSFAPDPVPT